MNTGIARGLGSPASQSIAAKTSSQVVPDIEICSSPLYAWLLIVFSGIFFCLGLLGASPLMVRHNVGLGLLVCVASAAGALVGNYLRHHLPVVVRMTQRQLSLPRGVVVNWTDIVEIQKKTLTVSRHGVRHSPEFVCFKLKNQPAKYGRANEAFLKVLKGAVLGGYDVVINPQDQLLKSADWFIAECRKRMSAAASAS